MKRSFFQGRGAALIGACCLGLLLFSWAPASEPTAGLVTTKPTAGRFVETENGFMVPYTEKIPGTKVAIQMTPIPGGKFLLGSVVNEPNRKPDEGPQVAIEVPPFWMGVYEITWSDYRPFMNLYNIHKNREPRIELTDDNRADAFTIPTPLYEPEFTFGLGSKPRQPAVTMSQYAARQYTKWISKATERFFRLPSECEWEYACRAGSTTAYSFGDDPAELNQYAWSFDNAEDTYHEVGQKLANAWGLYDMIGNVAEMTLDQYAEDTYGKVAPESVAQVFVWPTKLQGHVIRGGSWDSDPPALRSAARDATADWRNEDPNLPKSPWWFTDEEALCVGFRVVRPLVAPPQGQRNQYWDATVEYLREDVESRVAEGRGVYGLVPNP